MLVLVDTQRECYSCERCDWSACFGIRSVRSGNESIRPKIRKIKIA